MQEQNYSLDAIVGFFHMLQNDVRLTPMHISLYFALLDCWIQNNYQSPFPITRKLMMQAAKIKSIATYHKYIIELQMFGYINYQPSYHPANGSLISLRNDK